MLLNGASNTPTTIKIHWRSFPQMLTLSLYVSLRSLLNLSISFCTLTPKYEDAVLVSQAVGDLRDICRNSSER